MRQGYPNAFNCRGGEKYLGLLAKLTPLLFRPSRLFDLPGALSPLALLKLSAIVEQHITAAAVNCPGKGAHAFRHGFATRMLQQGHSLKEIADVLGHRHLGTTFIYTKVDFNSLEQVPLDWPQEVLP